MNDDDDYISFGDVSRNRMDIQCQYGSQYIDGSCGRVNLGEGLRFKNIDSHSYHNIKIHKDDVEEFVRRYKNHIEQLNNLFEYSQDVKKNG